MYIEFRTGRLERCYRERRVREATWGKAVAQKYIQAVDLLKAADHPSDLRQFRSLNYHPLTADRQGQHALYLGKRERLIFSVREAGDEMIARIEKVSTTHYDH